MANRVPYSRMGDTINFGDDNVEDEVTGVTFDMLDEDDEILIQAEHIRPRPTYSNQADENADVDTTDINFDEEMEDVEAANISIGLVTDPIATEADPDLEESGFDFSAGKLWIYPTNYPVRDYQYNIVQKALYKNTLVVLPTGLGKTFIAAVVMYNFFRWFPQGKIVFMAPTKPLVAQQIQACYNIMGIPQADTIEMTGTMNPVVRQKAWKEKRVVFLTPQVMTNDLSRGSLTANSIKCLVLDEAHKALGNHSYCQVVRELVKFTRQCRILALSATPGGDLKSVQQVMNNLLISHIELRSEESIDISKYTHERKVEKIVIPLGEELSGIKLKYIKVMSCVVQRLIKNNVLFNRDVSKVSTGSLLKARVAFRQNPPHNMQQIQRGTVEADFSTAISLCYGFALLQNHGLRSLYNYLTGIITGEKGYGQTRYELLRNADFSDIVEILRQKFLVSDVDGASLTSGDHKVVISHPKVQRLEEIVVAHFRSFQNNGEETRVMIFSEYRDSVQEISSVLNQHQPLIKAMPFIGQSSAGKSSKGYTQKDQLMVMRLFREGGYNTLVSTCVGEEGLDIGDVDLIICFDAHNSPVRLVQRMGRTGRKRKGRIVMLVTEGKEEQIYNHSLYSMKAIHKAILNGAKTLHFYPNNPRMVPPSVTPQCHKMHITVATESVSSTKSKKTPRKSKDLVGSKNRKISTAFGNQGKKVVENGYLTSEEYDEIRKEFSEVPSTAKYLPRPKCITLSSHTEKMRDKPRDNIPQQIDFAEWMPWQNCLQSTQLIGHSIQSIHLVKDTEFIQLQQCLEDDEDHYASEMNQFLNVKDIGSGNEHSDRQSSIFSFLTHVHDTSETEQISKLHLRSKTTKVRNEIHGRGKNKTKKIPVSKTKKVIADETVAEPVVISSDSSLDNKLEKVAAKFDHLKPGGSKLFTELNDHDHKSNIQNPGSSKKGANECANTTRSFSSKQATNKKAKCSRNGQKIQPKGTKRKRKSVLALMESNAFKFSSDDDNDDFETDCPIRKRIGSCGINLKANICDEGMQGNTDAIIDNIALDVLMVSNDSGIKNSECKEFCPEKSLDNNTQKQIQEYNVSRCADKEQSSEFCNTEAFRIPTPPPVSGLKELFQGLKSEKDFAELDLEELMEQWERSEWNVCKAGGSNYKELCLEEQRSDLRFTFINMTAGGDASAENELNNVGLHVDDEGSQFNHLVRSCGGKHLHSPPSRESLINSSTKTCVAAVEKVQHNISKSPLFKSLANKSLHGNNHLLVRTSGSSEEISGLGNKEAVKTSKGQDEDFPDDSSYSKCLDKNHADNSKTSQQIQLGTSALSNEKNDTLSLTEDMSHSKLSNPLITGQDETEMNINISIKDMSLGKLHESFVTFTQAMECLQASSSEEAPKDYNVSTPHVSPSKFENYFGKSGNKLLSSDNGLSNNRTESSNTPAKDSKPYCRNEQAKDVDFRNRQRPSSPSSSLTEGFIDSPVSKHRSCQNNLEIPQFDLGFDLDDDDDVIPPTPVKNLSQESVFGFKTFISSKNLSEGTFTSSTATNKLSEDPKRCGSDTLEGNQSTSALGMGVDIFEPVVSAFDLELSSDEDDDWKHSENIKMFSLQQKNYASVADAKNQQKDEQLCKDLHKLRRKRLFENHEGAPCEADKNTLGNEHEKDENEFYNSSPKRQKLPFDMCSSNSKKELKSTLGTSISTAKDMESASEYSPAMSAKSKAGKLRMGKKLLHFSESAQKSSSTVITSDVDKIYGYSHLESCRGSLDEVLKNFTEVDEYNKQVSDINSENVSDMNEKLTTSSLGFQLDTQSVCRMKETYTVLTSPHVWENTDNATTVKASTPVRDAPRNNLLLRDVLNGDGGMPDLTPIRAHKIERESDSDHSIVVRRRKRAMVLDVSSDLDARAETTNVDTNYSRMGNVYYSKQSGSRTVKGATKSCSDDPQQISISNSFNDDIGDFVDDHSSVCHPKKYRHSKNMKRKKTKKAAEFIEKEADVSGDDDMSSDENEEVDDFYESSFIDNNTEVTQTQGADMKAVYLKSIKSPVLDGLAGRFKMQFNRKQDINVFSQTQDEDHGMSEYEEDSFCVGSDEEDISYLEEESPFAKPQQQKFSKNKTRELKRRKNRIKVMSNSSSEEDKDIAIQLTQEFSTRACKNGRRVLLSSSEDEGGKEDDSPLRNNELFTNNFDKSCRTFPEELCNNDSVRLESLNMTKNTDVSPASIQNKAHLNTSVSTHHGLKDCQAVAADVGNFDMLEDWFEDFDLPAVDNCKKARPSNQDNRKTKSLCTESKSLSLKNTTSKCDKNINENEPSLYEGTGNYIFSENNTNFKLQKGNSSKRCSIPSPTHYVAPVLDISTQDPYIQSKSGDNHKIHQEPSTSKDVHLSRCNTSMSPIESDITPGSCTSRSTLSTSIDWSQNSQVSTNSNRQIVAMTREERLLRQKEKQETYRKKLKQVQQISGSTGPPFTDSLATSIVIPETDIVCDKADVSTAARDSSSRTDGALVLAQARTSSNFTKLMETQKPEHQLQILVDSREISSAQEIISALRLKHGIGVTARQLSCCDYILSNHLAADRIQWSTFSNSSHRSKLSSRLCEMQALYERCVLIVELDRIKTGQEKSRKPVHRTKYLDSTLSYLTQSKVKVYSTDNAEETATILADLCQVEKIKGRALNVPVQLSSTKEEAFKFMLSMPGVTVPQALNLAHRFRSIFELLSSPAVIIQERGCMTLDSAVALHKFMHHKFDVHTMSGMKS